MAKITKDNVVEFKMSGLADMGSDVNAAFPEGSGLLELENHGTLQIVPRT